MIICSGQNRGLDEGICSLYNSELHTGLFVFIVENEDQIDDLFAYKLNVFGRCCILELRLIFFFKKDHLEKRYGFGYNTKDEHAGAFEINDFHEIGQQFDDNR